MNIPWKVSETQSSAVSITGQSPVPTADFTAVSGAIDVRGYDWIEFSIELTNNIGGTPITELFARVDYGDSAGPTAGTWYPLTVEDVAVDGSASQQTYQASRATQSQSTMSWRLPVPVHGQQMRIKFKGDGTPDATSTIAVYAYRRSF